MGVIDRLRAFWRAFRRNEPSEPVRHSGHSLARTLEDSTHVRGLEGGMARAGTEEQHELVAEGHEQYTKSLRDDD